MRRVADYSLWLGNALDASDVRGLHAAGIEALVDLALNEPLLRLTRELIYCRFPLLDGPGNKPEVLQLAVATTARLIAANIPTLVFCSAGMSRSPAIAACALALATKRGPEDALALVLQDGPRDISPGLWVNLLKCTG